MFKFSTQ